MNPQDRRNHDAQIAVLEEKVGRLEDDMAKALERIDEILELLTEAKGGWRVIFAIGSAVAAISSAVVWIAHEFFLRRP